ncbi:TetR/AcrR family transcriptional regulator [Allobranchiibius sp. GilTou73]|uniref:TetR/AcrR family transcriptional regulator n=1 Tax=Allobranchiibius sp. GilTou73 TaxID=2904523 RepID=UPI00351CC10E
MRELEAQRAERRRRLSLDQIVSATVDLIDEQGIAAASMRTVARQLGVQVMALYRYVANREDLFDAVVDHIVGELDDDPTIQQDVGDDGWQPYLTDLAWGVRRYARAHPHAFPLVATRPPAPRGSIRPCVRCAGSRPCWPTCPRPGSTTNRCCSPTGPSTVSCWDTFS